MILHEALTSLAVTLNASQSILGRIFHRKEGLYSMSDCSSSASSKWRGKERGEALHALTAQVRKFTVSIFMPKLPYSLCCFGDDDYGKFSLPNMAWAHSATFSVVLCSTTSPKSYMFYIMFQDIDLFVSKFYCLVLYC